jgi:DNA-binding CsgD family transcriptional regulator
VYRFADADRYLTEGIRYAAERDLDYARHYMQAWLALTRLCQGRWAEAGVAERTQTLQRLGPVRAARAEAAWLADDHPRARAEARATWDLALHHRHPWHTGELRFWRRRAGERVRLSACAAPPFARQVAGDWRRAATLRERLGCPYERARALAEGDEPAQLAALEIFDRLGARPDLERLRASGARHIPRGPRPATRGNPLGLSAREAEIAALLARALTNARIGARLHISPKTVDHHVSAILGKLDVASREEAGRVALQLGLGPQDGEAVK